MTQITDKQIAYLDRLSGGRWQDAVAEDMGCSPSAAYKRATSADASRTIARLLARNPQRAARPSQPRTSRTSGGDWL